MQNDIKTKSTDFLPGKPSIDSVAKSATPPNTDANLQPTAAPASAHVIDLKKASVSPIDSPLLDSKPAEEPTNIAPAPAMDTQKEDKSDITVKPVFDQPTPTNQASTPTPEPSPTTEKTDIDNLNLTDSTAQPAAIKTDKPKKSSKLKWILFAVLGIIVGAAIVVGVIYILNTVAK